MRGFLPSHLTMGTERPTMCDEYRRTSDAAAEEIICAANIQALRNAAAWLRRSDVARAAGDASVEMGLGNPIVLYNRARQELETTPFELADARFLLDNGYFHWERQS